MNPLDLGPHFYQDINQQCCHYLEDNFTRNADMDGVYEFISTVDICANTSEIFTTELLSYMIFTVIAVSDG